MSTFTELYLQAALAGELGDEKYVRVVLDLSERAKGPKSLQRDPGRIHGMLAHMGPRAQRVMDAAVDIERAWAVNTDVCLRFPINFIAELRGMPEIRSIRPARRHVTQLDETLRVHEILEPQRSAMTGRGVRIAILDSGIDLNHPDLRGRVDLNASRNFSSEGPPHYVNDMNGHGTHVAGIIAGHGPTYR
jgi:subtilisin family serine protease